VLLEKARSLQQSGHLAEAMGYNQVLALQSDNHEACYGIGKFYESLTAQPETVSCALVDFCGLDWDERCLRFYETKRFINTASYDQVRQPIYERSIGRARHYEKHLQILRNLLEV
jgi:hypothetical protein